MLADRFYRIIHLYLKPQLDSGEKLIHYAIYDCFTSSFDEVEGNLILAGIPTTIDSSGASRFLTTAFAPTWTWFPSVTLLNIFAPAPMST
jgi:hypothetical protein